MAISSCSLVLGYGRNVYHWETVALGVMLTMCARNKANKRKRSVIPVSKHNDSEKLKL
jgi:hypothetical protein